MEKNDSTIPESLTEQFSPGDLVVIDEGYTNECRARVVNQTPQRLYTRVESDGVQWEVMTVRLRKCYSPQKLKSYG